MKPLDIFLNYMKDEIISLLLKYSLKVVQECILIILAGTSSFMVAFVCPFFCLSLRPPELFYHVSIIRDETINSYSSLEMPMACMFSGQKVIGEGHMGRLKFLSFVLHSCMSIWSIHFIFGSNITLGVTIY